MSKQFRPLKAPSKGIPDSHLPKLRFPLLASPKLDGLRLLNRGGAVTSSLKPVSNNHTRALCSVDALSGLDGECTVGDGDSPVGFKKAQSAVMAEEGKYDIIWWVFDIHEDEYVNVPFKERYALLKARVAAANLPYVQYVPHELINDMNELLAYEKRILDLGFEGVMLRDPMGRYKYDRSTLNEGILLKLKRGNTKRGDAEIIGFKERQQNNNPVFINERGLSERSSHQENMVGRGDLGSFQVRDTETGVEFAIGTGDGLDDNLRLLVWNNQAAYRGKIIRYEWFDYGGYDKPRFPKFVDFRLPE